MAARLPLPPIARRVNPIEWGIVAGAWLLLNQLAVDPLGRELVERGIAITPEQLRIGLLLDWCVWVPLVPLIFRVLDHFPLREGVRLRHAGAWVLTVLAFGAIHALITLPLILLLGRALGVPPSALAVPEFRLGRMVLDDAQNAILAVTAYVILQLLYRGRDERAHGGLGSYQLGDILGRGGMGEVYHATHRMLGRPVAIKLIRPEMVRAAGEQAQLAIRRFRREAEIAASLRSPHTVELHDFGVTPDQTFYFVMELLDGMDLETLVRQTGPVPPSRAIYILRQVCDSLEEAHARGLVHRDIKPANIHVGRLGMRHDFVKVLDFGLVKSVDGPKGEDSLATAAGITPGTPAYMAPEMAMGETFDGRADIYAVGCVAYYMLTGQRVFEADTALQVIAKHLREEPVPPSRRAAQPVPAPMDHLVLACLAKEPSRRPRSAAELSAALGAIGGEPWGEEQAMAWWQTH
jgi:tRNA A-37 threonylcarbamoyl transferase component Bud32